MDDLSAFREKNERNARVQQRYDELASAGKRGHYETMFKVVREEVEAERSRNATVLRNVIQAIDDNDDIAAYAYAKTALATYGQQAGNDNG